MLDTVDLHHEAVFVEVHIEVHPPAASMPEELATRLRQAMAPAERREIELAERLCPVRDVGDEPTREPPAGMSSVRASSPASRVAVVSRCCTGMTSSSAACRSVPAQSAGWTAAAAGRSRGMPVTM